MNLESPFLTLAEASRFLKQSEVTTRRLVKQRAIPYRRHGSRYLFHQAELLAWSEARKVEPVTSLSRFRQVQADLRSLTTEHTLAVLEKG